MAQQYEEILDTAEERADHPNEHRNIGTINSEDEISFRIPDSGIVNSPQNIVSLAMHMSPAMEEEDNPDQDAQLELYVDPDEDDLDMDAFAINGAPNSMPGRRSTANRKKSIKKPTVKTPRTPRTPAIRRGTKKDKSPKKTPGKNKIQAPATITHTESQLSQARGQRGGKDELPINTDSRSHNCKILFPDNGTSGLSMINVMHEHGNTNQMEASQACNTAQLNIGYGQVNNNNRPEPEVQMLMHNQRETMHVTKATVQTAKSANEAVTATVTNSGNVDNRSVLHHDYEHAQDNIHVTEHSNVSHVLGQIPHDEHDKHHVDPKEHIIQQEYAYKDNDARQGESVEQRVNKIKQKVKELNPLRRAQRRPPMEDGTDNPNIDGLDNGLNAWLDAQLNTSDDEYRHDKDLVRYAKMNSDNNRCYNIDDIPQKGPRVKHPITIPRGKYAQIARQLANNDNVPICRYSGVKKMDNKDPTMDGMEGQRIATAEARPIRKNERQNRDRSFHIAENQNTRDDIQFENRERQGMLDRREQHSMGKRRYNNNNRSYYRYEDNTYSEKYDIPIVDEYDSDEDYHDYPGENEYNNHEDSQVYWVAKQPPYDENWKYQPADNRAFSFRQRRQSNSPRRRNGNTRYMDEHNRGNRTQ